MRKYIYFILRIWGVLLNIPNLFSCLRKAVYWLFWSSGVENVREKCCMLISNFPVTSEVNWNPILNPTFSFKMSVRPLELSIQYIIYLFRWSVSYSTKDIHLYLHIKVSWFYLFFISSLLLVNVCMYTKHISCMILINFVNIERNCSC